MKHAFISWLPLAFASIIFFGVLYGTEQQILRQSANDPQIQLAEDGAALLSSGVAPSALIGSLKIDMASSTSSFVNIFDDTGKLVDGFGYLNGKRPTPPSGVFEGARTRSDVRMTLQPMPHVRIAAVIRHYGGEASGFIVVGRSLKETEARISRLGTAVLIGFALELAGTLLLYWFLGKRSKK